MEPRPRRRGAPPGDALPGHDRLSRPRPAGRALSRLVPRRHPLDGGRGQPRDPGRQRRPEPGLLGPADGALVLLLPPQGDGLRRGLHAAPLPGQHPPAHGGHDQPRPALVVLSAHRHRSRRARHQHLLRRGVGGGLQVGQPLLLLRADLRPLRLGPLADPAGLQRRRLPLEPPAGPALLARPGTRGQLGRARRGARLSARGSGRQLAHLLHRATPAAAAPLPLLHAHRRGRCRRPEGAPHRPLRRRRRRLPADAGAAGGRPPPGDPLRARHRPRRPAALRDPRRPGPPVGGRRRPPRRRLPRGLRPRRLPAHGDDELRPEGALARGRRPRRPRRQAGLPALPPAQRRPLQLPLHATPSRRR